MKRLGYVGLFAALLVLCLGATANAGTLVWNFSNPGDYYAVNGDNGPPNYDSVPFSIAPGGPAVVTPLPYLGATDEDDVYGSDEAAVFARVNTQAAGLTLDKVVGGGFVINNFIAGTVLSSTPDGSGGYLNSTTNDTPSSIFGSLYLSPTGGSGSNILINLNMTPTQGPTGTWTYGFNLNTPTDGYDYTSPFTGDGTWISGTGGNTLGDVIAAIDSASYGPEYVAFFGPQIGMSGTSGTGFDVTQISLDVVPEPISMIFFGTGLVAIGGYVSRKRMLRKA